MKDLQEATEHICDLKGSVLALNAFVASIIQVLPWDALPPLAAQYASECETARAVLLGSLVSERTRSAFERDAQLVSETLRAQIDNTSPGLPPLG